MVKKNVDLQLQQQHGGGSIIERADGHQRETAKTKAKALPQTTPQVGDLLIRINRSIVAPVYTDK